MRRIFVNTSLGYLRKNNVLSEAVPVESAIQLDNRDISALERMEVAELRRCIDKLPDGYRVVLNLYAVEGYSHKEIAQMLGISEGTSRSQYARAKIYLQKLLREAEII